MTVPASWYESSSFTLAEWFSRAQGLSQLEAISLACERKYGTSEYFVMHREERTRTNWSSVYLRICEELSIDEDGKTALVVGVNDGMDVETFSKCRVIGVDPCSKALAIAKACYPHYEFHQAIAESLPQQDKSVDAYIALRVVNCSTVNMTKLFAEFKRILKDGGAFIFSIATGFFVGDVLVPGVFKDGNIDTEYAGIVRERLLNKLQFLEAKIKVVHHDIETFIFGTNG